jgi:hypothetical protein
LHRANERQQVEETKQNEGVQATSNTDHAAESKSVLEEKRRLGFHEVTAVTFFGLKRQAGQQ